MKVKIFKCSYCGKKNKQIRGKIAKRKNYFCNRKCMGKFRKGKGNPRYGKYGATWNGKINDFPLRKYFRKLKKDKGCDICGERTKRMEIHHLKYKKRYNKKDIKYLRWLCSKCHKLANGLRGKKLTKKLFKK